MAEVTYAKQKGSRAVEALENPRRRTATPEQRGDVCPSTQMAPPHPSPDHAPLAPRGESCGFTEITRNYASSTPA